jgi:hypothetical protein
VPACGSPPEAPKATAPHRARERGQLANDVEQVGGAVDRPAVDEGRLAGARIGQDERAPRVRRALPAQREAHRKRAADRPQIAGQRELAGELEAVEGAGSDLPVGGEDAESRSAGRSGPTPSADRPARGSR